MMTLPASSAAKSAPICGIAPYGTETSTTEPNAAASRGVPDVSARPELLRERLELLRMTRRHEDLVARIDPVARERAADPARADDADLQRLLRRREPCVAERRGAHDEPGSGEQCATRN